MESLVHSVEGECEAYHQKGIHTKVVITNHRIASIEKKHVRGTGFRVFVNDCQGFAYTTDENRLEEAANLALKLAKSSTEVRKFPVPEECGKVEGLSDPGLKAVDVESISEMVQTMLSGAAEGGGRAVYGSVEITELHHEIVTSYGIAGNFEETSCYAGIDVEVDGYFGTETLYTRNSDINFFDVGKRAADLAAASKNPQNIKGGIMPVILRPPCCWYPV